MNADAFRQDVRYAARALRARSGFTATAVLTLCLGMGATTAVFSVIDGVLLQPFAIQDQDRVLVVWKTLTEREFEYMPFTFASYEELRERVQSAELAGHPYHGASRAVLNIEGVTRPLYVAGVTGDWFRVLGVRPLAGRLLTPADDTPGADPVAVLTPGAATRLFGVAADAMGATIQLNEITYSIVGIAPHGFEFPREAEVWVAAAPFFLAQIEGATSLRDAQQVGWHMVARVREGFSAEHVRAELQSTIGALATEAEWLGRQQIRAPQFADVMVGDVRPALLMLGSAVLLVLIIAGANVANLLLVRGLTRRRELAVRNAVGASRGRILRQLATEAVMLVLISALFSLLVAESALQGLLALAPSELPRLASVGLDARALLFTGLLALVVAIAFGVLPALRSTRLENGAVLRSRDGVAEPGTRGHWLRHALLIGQIAVAALVLSTAGLLLRSLDRMQRLDPGFAADGVVLIEVTVPSGRYPLAADHQLAMQRLAERASLMAGVEGATALTTSPFAGNGGIDAIWYGEAQIAAAANNPYSNYEGADPAYFRTMGMPLLRGRGIESTDRAGSAPVVVVNEAFARLYWPGQDPIGRRIKMGTADAETEWRTVVGLVRDSRYRELTNARPGVYVPYGQGIPVRPRYIALRAAAGPAVAASTVRRAIEDVEPGAVVVSAATMPGLLAAPLARPRFQSALLSSFGLLALVLSVVGTYGVLAFFVRQRTREIGIRMALGADAKNVRQFVLSHGLIVGITGVSIGMVGAIALGRVMRTILFEVSPADPLVLSLAAASLLAATLAATLVPTRLAARTDPLLVMRNE